MKCKLIFVVLCCLMLTSVQGAIVHRYDFNDPNGVNDDVGTADGVLVNNTTRSVFDDGQLKLGNQGIENSNDNNGDYVDLPNGIITALSDRATFETWTTWNGSSNNWERIFDFGNSDGGEDISGGAGASYYIFLTPQSGETTLRFGMNNPLPERVELTINDDSLPAGIEHHLVVSWDGPNNNVSMYLDGELVDEGDPHFTLADLGDDVNNWLGRAQWPDPMYVGNYNEFRIYDHAMTASEVTASLLAGTEVTIASPVYPANNDAEVAQLPTLQWAAGYVPSGSTTPTYKVYLSDDIGQVADGMALFVETADTSYTLVSEDALAPDSTYYWRIDQVVTLPGMSDPNVIVGGITSFDTIKTYPLLSTPDVAWAMTGDPVVITVEISTATPVTSCQWFKYVDGINDIEMAGAGISVDFSDTATTLTIDAVEAGDEGDYYCIVTNSAGPSNSADEGLVYLDVRQGLIHRYSFIEDPNDSVGDADGTLMGQAVIEDGQVVFNQTEGTFVDLPPHMLSGLTSVTFMVWVNPGHSTWSRVIDFGDRAEDGAGINYFFFAPTGRYAMKDGSTEQYIGGSLPIGSMSQVACVYDADGDSNVMRLYINGQFVAERANSFPMSVVNDVHCWLGQSGYEWDAWFLGSIDEFRMFDVPLNDGWIKAYYEAGPDELATDACVAPPLFDVAGNDCIVDIQDFAVFAESWLECGLDSCQ